MTFVAWLRLSKATLPVCLLLVGCRPTELRFHLRSDVQANTGRPLVVLVRSIDGAGTFRKDRYSDIERLVIAPDASVLHTLSLQPGLAKPQRFAIPYPSQGGIAVYALYAQIVSDWRVLFPSPVPDRIELLLGPDGIDRTQTREHRPLRLPRPPAALKGLTDSVRPAVPTPTPPTLPGGGPT